MLHLLHLSTDMVRADEMGSGFSAGADGVGVGGDELAVGAEHVRW